MDCSTSHENPLQPSLRRLGGGGPDEMAIRQAAWVARCVGRGEAAPFSAADLSALAPGHALDESTVLFLDGESFERLLASRPAIARRWLSSVAMRLAAGQDRIIGILGRTLTQQVARILADEAVAGAVSLPQRTLAAMLGVQRPSLNKILKDFERKDLIAVRYSAIELLDVERLAALAE